MCELFGAYGWNFGVRDMKYLLDHLLCRGVPQLGEDLRLYGLCVV